METNVCGDDDWMSAEEEALLLTAFDKLEEELKNGLKNPGKPNETESAGKHENRNYDKRLRIKGSYPKLQQATSTTMIQQDRRSERGPTNCEICANHSDDNGTVEGTVEDLTKEADPSQSTEGHAIGMIATKANAVTTDQSTVTNAAQLGEADTSESDLIITIAETPLEIYRGKYLKVTDLTAQAWCEQQLVYSFSVPKEVLQTPAMEKGTDLHLAKELEVHDIEQVAVTTKEDSWAIKVLNIFISLTQLISGSQKIREMPIFGEPFGQGIFFSGIIDEIRWKENEGLELVEFKTRVKSKTLPSVAQRRTHKLQVSLYKHMFDNAVEGVLSKESIANHVGLVLDRPLSDSVLKHMIKLNLDSRNLAGIIDKTLEQFQFLPRISSLITEYTSQSDSTPFASESYDFDEGWLRGEVDKSLQFWRGEREPVGVDIEDAWKCHSCLFEETCEWKQRQIEECIRTNAVKKPKVH